MKRIFFSVVVAVSLVTGCSLGDVEKSKPISKVHIKSNGAIVTSYNLDSNNRIVRSSSVGRYGVPVTRDYSYRDNGELLAVKSVKADVVKSMAYSYDYDTKGRKVSSVRSSTGGADVKLGDYTVEYAYDTDGKVSAIILTDSRGNVVVRNTLDEEQ